MSAPSPVRIDGEFAEFYAVARDIRAVIAAYRAVRGIGYREAWVAWFRWAMIEHL